MKKHQGGFTLIELVMVIVILGILAASFAPTFVNMSTDAQNAARAAASGAVKSALTIAVADLKTNPTVTQLAGYVQGGNATAVNTGVQVDTKDENGATVTVVVPTYTAANCTGATAAPANVVACVGDAASLP